MSDSLAHLPHHQRANVLSTEEFLFVSGTLGGRYLSASSENFIGTVQMPRFGSFDRRSSARAASVASLDPGGA